MPRKATIDASTEHVGCRTFGHAWPVKPTSTEEVDAGIAIVLTCARCTTARVDIASRRGVLIRRRYVYPDGYRRTREQYMPRDDWRAAYLRVTGVL